LACDNARTEGNLPQIDDRKNKKERVLLQVHSTKAVGKIGLLEEKIGRTSKVDRRNGV